MEYAPPTRRAKPITKAQLRKMQEQYSKSWITSAENLLQEEEERKRIQSEFDDEFKSL
jgi:hypothetical protein